MSTHKLVPFIWFHNTEGKINEILGYYKNIFNDHFITQNIVPLGASPSGNVEMCAVSIFSNPYQFMCTSLVHQALNDAFAMILYCDHQEEIDTYWNYFTNEGEESMCGWCIDKFGLRWQILPSHLAELMRKENAYEILMGQKKIIISDFH